MKTDDEPEVVSESNPARDLSKQDSEGQKDKLGSDSLEPRRLSVPVPGSEVQAMTPSFRTMLKKLEDLLSCTSSMSSITTCLLLSSEEGPLC